jgi:hypothetical protein
MDLRQIVQDYVLRIGNQQASQFFGKNISTIKSWRSTGIIPIQAVEKVLTELGYQLIAPEGAAAIPETEQNQLCQLIENLTQRISALEGGHRTPEEEEPAEPADPLLPSAPTVPPTTMTPGTIPPARPQPPPPPTVPPGAGMWLKPRVTKK